MLRRPRKSTRNAVPRGRKIAAGDPAEGAAGLKSPHKETGPRRRDGPAAVQDTTAGRKQGATVGNDARQEGTQPTTADPPGGGGRKPEQEEDGIPQGGAERLRRTEAEGRAR